MMWRMTTLRRPLLAAALLAASRAGAQPAAITGTATYRERIALPPGAVLEVELLDVSRQDVAAVRIAQRSIPVHGQVPIAFTLPFDPARIEERLTYAVRAGIRVGGQVMFRTDRIFPVLTRGAGHSVDLLLVRAREQATAPAAPSLAGPEWIVEDIGARGVVDRARVSITFGAEGRAYGSGGCNRFTGGYTLDGASLRFAQMAGTMMACVPALGEQEQRFHAALAEVRAWRIENGLLHLTNGAGATVIRASRGG
jgi:putative lipoprotein